MALRIQKERLTGALLPSLREYSREFGLNASRLALAKPDAIVMHPGPINRGVELDDAIANCEQSVILDQVEAGVAVRMAVLYLLSAEPGQAPLEEPVDPELRHLLQGFGLRGSGPQRQG